MPNNHPYDKKGDRRQQNLNDLVDGAVNFGLDISSTVLSGIAGALDSVGDSLNRAAQRPEQNSFIAYRRKLDNSLAGHYGGWMTMGVLGWVFGGCFAIAALVMAILAGAAPNDASLWSAMPVFNILAPTFTACTLGFFVMGYAGCHAANYFGRLRRYLRGMHGFTAELPELTRSSVVRADKVRKDLRDALAKGHYPNACMNEAETTLYLDETMYPPAPAAAPVQPKAAQPALTDEELRAKTKEYKDRYNGCECFRENGIQGFATVREAAKRSLGMEHHRVQLIGGIILHQGRIAEMKTGEGKTLVSTLPAYLNALTGRGVHIVTVNDYLANRDAEWMGKVHRFLGLTVGVVLNDMKNDERRQQYACDITYITNNELGFD